MSFHIQLGDLAEWVAGIGTSAAVLISVNTVRRDHKDRREANALLVVPTVGPSGGPPGLDGQPVTYMHVNVGNGSAKPIRDVAISVVSKSGDPLEEWHADEIPPISSVGYDRVPEEGAWARTAGRVFNVVVRVSFTDADRKRWLRDSSGTIKRL